jgi:hypothetical protein
MKGGGESRRKYQYQHISQDTTQHRTQSPSAAVGSISLASKRALRTPDASTNKERLSHYCMSNVRQLEHVKSTHPSGRSVPVTRLSRMLTSVFR